MTQDEELPLEPEPQLVDVPAPKTNEQRLKELEEQLRWKNISLEECIT